MKKNDVINKLAWIIVEAASKGYVSSNDLDFANDCLDKVQGQSNTGLQSDEKVRICSRCGSTSPKELEYCGACGYLLAAKA